VLLHASEIGVATLRERGEDSSRDAEGHHYIDGGFYSSDNADLAAGFDQVIVSALRPPWQPPSATFREGWGSTN
jgi:hypothetical protein